MFFFHRTGSRSCSLKTWQVSASASPMSSRGLMVAGGAAATLCAAWEPRWSLLAA